MTGRRLHPPVHRRTCVGANDVELVADAHGDPDAPAVLLLHGGGQTRHSWGGVAETLSNAGFYAVNADLRGHGQSGWDPNGDYSFAAQMIDVEAWCDLLGGPAIVGASLGGLAGLWTEGTRAANGQPPAGSCLVLVDIAHRSEAEGVERIVSFMRGTRRGSPTSTGRQTRLPNTCHIGRGRRTPRGWPATCGSVRTVAFDGIGIRSS
jgi:pimeloyl-ACP methyl ester carboxylesterase